MINEYESRLVDDVRQFLLKLAPASHPYLHNDLHLRPQSEEVAARCRSPAGIAVTPRRRTSAGS